MLSGILLLFFSLSWPLAASGLGHLSLYSHFLSHLTFTFKFNSDPRIQRSTQRLPSQVEHPDSRLTVSVMEAPD